MNALLLATNADEAVVLSKALQRAGLVVHYAQGLEQVMRSWPNQPADFILLALSTPSPVEQVRYVRSQVVLPLLVLIVDPTEGQSLQVALLGEGADLVVTRPYSARLLTCQVQTLLRRVINPPGSRWPVLSGFALN